MKSISTSKVLTLQLGAIFFKIKYIIKPYITMTRVMLFKKSFLIEITVLNPGLKSFMIHVPFVKA